MCTHLYSAIMKNKTNSEAVGVLLNTTLQRMAYPRMYAYSCYLSNLYHR